MSGLMDKIGQAVGNKENTMGQPGDKVEASADNGVNQKLNDFAGEAGVPQQADGIMDKFADNKVNSDIPGGN